MNSGLKDALNNLSLMLVMTTPGDRAGIDLLLSLCDDAQKAASGEARFERLCKAVDLLKAQAAADDILATLGAFVNAALQDLENAGEARYPGEGATGENAPVRHPDVSADVDESFLVEFIETHSLLLDDFEAALVDVQRIGESPDEVTTYVKRYLHNIKGDAGSIGLLGVERVCHALEDMLEETSLDGLSTILLQFKEWVSSSMKQIAAGGAPAVTAEQFLSSHKPAQTVASAVLAAPKQSEAQVDIDEYDISGEADILLEFAAEAEEHLNNVESIILDSDGTFDKDAVDTIFRGIHSLKGGSAYFTLEEMMRSSHILENFLSEVRDGKRRLDSRLHSLLLVYIDLQKDILKRAKVASASGTRMTFSKSSKNFLKSLDSYERGTMKVEVQAEPSPEDASAEQAAEEPEVVESSGTKLQVKDFVKVDTTRLDHLIDSIGEMVIYSSMLVRHCRELLGNHEGVMDTTHRVEKFSRDLQDIGMSMRLVPIKGLFQKMSRLVWDTSKKLGKNIQFSMHGEDTELDRNLIDKLADPLMHMVRNALDHGVEPSAEREAKGKPKAGTVTLSAFHAGGSIHIQIKDDGRGLNPEKLFAKAVEKGIVQPGQKLTQNEMYQLIFAPGFSTAATVTDISGRGVGMDVVRRNVESLRGRIHIQSEIDKGSTFTIELPLTLAIIDGIQIRVGAEHFIVPSLSIVEFVRPNAGMITNALDIGETFHFRGKYLPVFRLADLYGIDSEHLDPERATMIVVENSEELVALMVDEVLGQYSTVIKNLGPAFEDGKGLAGCAIMPNGDVALILDIRSLVQLARASYSRRLRASMEGVSVQ